MKILKKISFAGNRNVLVRGMLVATALIAQGGALAAQNWALPRISVAQVREQPRHAAELGTQMFMEILEQAENFKKYTFTKPYSYGNEISTAIAAES